MREQAFLNAGVKIIMRDLRGEEILTDSDSNMTLLSVTGTVTGAPSLPELDNPRWKAWWRGGSIRLTKSYGTTVVFR
jgi:hypothetical protein